MGTTRQALPIIYALQTTTLNDDPELDNVCEETVVMRVRGEESGTPFGSIESADQEDMYYALGKGASFYSGPDVRAYEPVHGELHRIRALKDGEISDLVRDYQRTNPPAEPR